MEFRVQPCTSACNACWPNKVITGSECLVDPETVGLFPISNTSASRYPPRTKPFPSTKTFWVPSASLLKKWQTRKYVQPSSGSARPKSNFSKARPKTAPSPNSSPTTAVAWHTARSLRRTGRCGKRTGGSRIERLPPDRQSPRRGAEGLNIAFLHPESPQWALW